MSEKDWRALVADMIEHAQHARRHAEGLDEAAFVQDLKTIHAVTRCVEIIGEAARAVPDEFASVRRTCLGRRSLVYATYSLITTAISASPTFGECWRKVTSSSSKLICRRF
jgi:hypothetical protein